MHFLINLCYLQLGKKEKKICKMLNIYLVIGQVDNRSILLNKQLNQGVGI